eukprot:TRINITY_DN30675_c0_g1_i1.p1 TRINITY_DN30675_c0_g1~~TRINITY_DN30675_c0_g1_i1.p1  ORF type:complete len:1042 (-),score=165.96 TRINITY_DN30675_c0_g1_i1:28-3153(-)
MAVATITVDAGDAFIAVQSFVCAAFACLIAWLVLTNGLKLSLLQSAPIEKRLAVCCSINTHIAVVSFFLNMFQFTGIDDLIVRDAFPLLKSEKLDPFIVDMARPVEWLVTCPMMQLVLVLIGGPNIPGYRRMLMPGIAFALIACSVGSTQGVAESPLRITCYVMLVFLMILLCLLNVRQIYEHCGNKASLCCGNSMFRTATLWFCVGWFPYIIWFFITPDGLGFERDLLICRIGWALICVFSKFGFLLHVKYFNERTLSHLRVQQALRGIEPGAGAGILWAESMTSAESMAAADWQSASPAYHEFSDPQGPLPGEAAAPPAAIVLSPTSCRYAANSSEGSMKNSLNDRGSPANGHAAAEFRMDVIEDLLSTLHNKLDAHHAEQMGVWLVPDAPGCQHISQLLQALEGRLLEGTSSIKHAVSKDALKPVIDSTVREVLQEMALTPLTSGMESLERVVSQVREQHSSRDESMQGRWLEAVRQVAVEERVFQQQALQEGIGELTSRVDAAKKLAADDGVMRERASQDGLGRLSAKVDAVKDDVLRALGGVKESSLEHVASHLGKVLDEREASTRSQLESVAFKFVDHAVAQAVDATAARTSEHAATETADTLRDDLRQLMDATQRVSDKSASCISDHLRDFETRLMEAMKESATKTTNHLSGFESRSVDAICAHVEELGRKAIETAANSQKECVNTSERHIVRATNSLNEVLLREIAAVTGRCDAMNKSIGEGRNFVIDSLRKLIEEGCNAMVRNLQNCIKDSQASVVEIVKGLTQESNVFFEHLGKSHADTSTKLESSMKILEENSGSILSAVKSCDESIGDALRQGNGSLVKALQASDEAQRQSAEDLRRYAMMILEQLSAQPEETKHIAERVSGLQAWVETSLDEILRNMEELARAMRHVGSADGQLSGRQQVPGPPRGQNTSMYIGDVPSLEPVYDDEEPGSAPVLGAAGSSAALASIGLIVDEDGGFQASSSTSSLTARPLRPPEAPGAPGFAGGSRVLPSALSGDYGGSGAGRGGDHDLPPNFDVSKILVSNPSSSFP